MEFKLPDSLSDTLVSYDATRRKAAAEAKRSTNVKKKKHQFGNINDLIPFDVVSAEDQQKAANHINKSLCEDRYYEFYTGLQGTPIAFVYHYESIWVACWLPWSIKDQCFTATRPNGKNYIYGFSFAHRDNKTTITKVGSSFCGGLYVHPDEIVECKIHSNRAHLVRYRRPLERKQLGKSNFVYKQVFVTSEMVNDGYEETPWDCPSNDSNISNWHQKSSNIRTVTRTWLDKLTKRILSWNTSSSYGYGSSNELWERMKGNNNSLHYLFKLQFEQELKSVVEEKDSYRYQRSNRLNNYYDRSDNEDEIRRQLLIKDVIPDNFIADYESILKIYKDLKSYEILFKYNFFDKKFIKRTITEASNKINASFKLSDNILATKEECNVEKIMGPILKLEKYFKHISFLYTVWGEKVPFDYLQDIDLYASMEVPDLYNGHGYIREDINKWLQTNMPIASYVQIINTQYKEKKEEYDKSETGQYDRTYHYNGNIGIYDIRFHELNDSLSMLNRLVKEHGQDFKKPKRWRIAEFHDYVQAESWKLTNENEPLPQDLFPTPVKATLDLNGALNIVQMTFFQPRDTHQLAEWGRAVRNCVGSAGYAERVRKKRNFIVLAMIENQPRYTIQLSLNNAVLHVDQIADVANARLEDQERSSTEMLFKEAIRIRTDERTN